jgi:hypothetical protein
MPDLMNRHFCNKTKTENKPKINTYGKTEGIGKPFKNVLGNEKYFDLDT